MKRGCLNWDLNDRQRASLKRVRQRKAAQECKCWNKLKRLGKQRAWWLECSSWRVIGEGEEQRWSQKSEERAWSSDSLTSDKPSQGAWVLFHYVERRGRFHRGMAWLDIDFKTTLIAFEEQTWEPGDQTRVNQEEANCGKAWTRIAVVRRKEEDRVVKPFRDGSVDFEGLIGCTWWWWI